MTELFYTYVSLSLAILCIPTAVPGQQSQGSPDVAGPVQALVKQHEAWSEKNSTPGAFIRVKETGREGAVARFNFYVSGLPDDRVYNVVSWPIDQSQPATIMEGVSLGKDGIVSCTGRLDGECSDPSGDKNNAVDFVFNSLTGEPNRLALIAGDQRAAVIVVPNPITSSDRGCTLSVKRLMPHFELAFFTGNGYEHDAKTTFQTDSYGEKHVVETTADHEGNVRFAVLPFVSGHQHGKTSIKAASLGCSPALTFDWGQ